MNVAGYIHDIHVADKMTSNSLDARLWLRQEWGAALHCIHPLILVAVLHKLSDFFVHVSPEEA